MGKILRIFDGCAGHLREPAEEVGERGRELPVAADEPAVVPKLMFDAVVVEDSRSNRRLANSARAK